MRGGYTIILFVAIPILFVAITEYFFVAITEKIVSMNLRPVSDWMKRQIFR